MKRTITMLDNLYLCPHCLAILGGLGACQDCEEETGASQDMIDHNRAMRGAVLEGSL